MNPILQQVEDGVDQITSSPDSKNQYERIVIAGKKIMFDEATHDKISWMQNPSDLAALVTGVADLITIIGEVSKNTMDADAAHGAAVTLVMEALDFSERAQGTNITTELVKAAVLAIDEKMREDWQQTPPTEQQAPPAIQPQGLINAGA